MWWRTSNCSPLLIYRPREDERLSWPGWLTYSGRLTHISGHPSATGWAQDGKRTLARDWRSTAEPHRLTTCGPVFSISNNMKFNWNKMSFYFTRTPYCRILHIFYNSFYTIVQPPTLSDQEIIALVNKTSHLNNSDFLIQLLYKYSY